MALPLAETLKLKRFINDLASHKALHTEFVSVYVPKDYDLTKIINHLAQEQGTASNIKSASTRKNVVAALERMVQHLRTINKTPPNGLAIFSGNVAAREGKQDLRVWSLEPPLPLNIRLYRCDKNFVTDVLEEMILERQVYGFVVLDRRDAMLALLKGKTIVPLKKTHSEVPGKFRAGGQCLSEGTEIILPNGKLKKIEKLNKGDLVQSYDFKNKKFISSLCTAIWKVTKKQKDILWINTEDSYITASLDHKFFVWTGTHVKEIPARLLKEKDLLFKVKSKKISLTKIELIVEGNQGYFRKNRSINLIDISVKNKNFIANGVIVHNSAQRFARIREGAYKEHFKKIAEYMKEQFLPLGNDLKGIIIGGPGTTVQDFLGKDYITGDIKRKIIGTKDLSYTEEVGLQELLDKSEDLLAKEEVADEKKLMKRFFEGLAKTPNKVSYGEKEVKKALEMGAVDLVLLSEKLPEEEITAFEELAKSTGAEVKLISVETNEGQQLKDMGGIAAILRYELE